MKIRARARAVVAILLFALFAIAQYGPGGFGRGSASPQFTRYPFDTWASENSKPQIRWSVHIDPARLSPHQRLVTTVHVIVDGAELKARQSAQLIGFARIEDSAGHRYQTSNQTVITHLNKGDQYAQLDFTFSAFMVPGDYVVSLAVCDGRTLEHSFTRQNLHVAAIKSDPLPLAWDGLPPVEFVPDTGIPYSWYLPQLRSVVRSPVNNEHPVRIELLLNTTPTELGSLNQFRANMQVVVPSLKVLMGIDPSAGSVGISIADLNRRILTYQQPQLHVADVGRGNAPGRGEWSKLRPVLMDFSASKVDAKTLAGQRKMLDYFSGEVTRLLGPADQPLPVPHVVIVLSAPVYFTQQERPPLPDLPPDPGRRVYYIRYTQFLPRSQEGQSYLFTDDLERILKPMGARIFRVMRPEDFRKALGTILGEIAAM